MTTASRLFIAALMATGLSGCIIVGGDHDEFKREFSSSDWEDMERDNRNRIAQLRIGERYEAIMGQMGQPSFTEAFQMDGATYQVLYYRTHRTHSDGETTKDETTPLVFKDSALIGWGMDALARVR
jgi:hypothetical protein